MATSDNVIRGCMTPKYIDKETLTEVLQIFSTNPHSQSLDTLI